MRQVYLLLFASMMCSATTALACRYNSSPSERINKAMANADTLVIGIVASAQYLTPADKPERAWTGKVHVQEVVRGKASTRTYEISRTGQSSMCDDGIAPPSAGDEWALYIRHANGGETVELAYPVDIASTTDLAILKISHVR